jgi:hypothetical protein
MKTTVALVLVGLLGTSARADVNPCADPPKKIVPPRRPPPKRPEPPRPAPCHCAGEKGEKGDTGEKGDRGDDGKTMFFYVTKTVRAEPAVKVSLGVTGFISNPHNDWAWGPAIRLSTKVSDRYDLAFEGGLAAGASDGRESGYILSLQGVRHLDRAKGLEAFLGIHKVRIEGSENNGNIDGDYLGLSAGIALQSGRVRLELGPTATGLRDDSEDGTQFAVGAHAALFVRLGQ